MQIIVADVLFHAPESPSYFDEVLVLHVCILVDFQAEVIPVVLLVHVELGRTFVIGNELRCTYEFPVMVLAFVEFRFEFKPLLSRTDKIISVFLWNPITQGSSYQTH